MANLVNRIVQLVGRQAQVMAHCHSVKMVRVPQAWGTRTILTLLQERRLHNLDLGRNLADQELGKGHKKEGKDQLLGRLSF